LPDPLKVPLNVLSQETRCGTIDETETGTVEETMNRENLESERKADDLGLVRGELVEKITRWTGKENQLTTPIPSLTFHRWEMPTEPTSYVLEPSICLIVQGVKRVLLGTEVNEYDAHHYLVTSVGLPVVAQIFEASSGTPYPGLTLELDQRSIAQLMVDSNLPPSRKEQAERGIAVSEVSLPLLNCFQRLIGLLDEPLDIPILAPLIQREILYRLLVGEQGQRLRQIGAVGSQSHQLARAIDWLKGHFNMRLRIDELASDTGMSPSTFHHHFRALTAMSPLQFQKRLRLNEARRLMFTERLDASTAAFEVGYESPSQFSREYSRLFGAPPLRDMKWLNQNYAGVGV
jgi:AraC-like DNA-binding protein